MTKLDKTVSQKNGIWLTWETQVRNHGLSKAFEYKFFQLDYKTHPIIRYGKSILESTLILLKEKPEIVAAQNPSIVLAFLAVFYKFWFKYYLIIDAHNSGITPKNGQSFILNRVAKYLQKKADLTIVTNESLAEIVNKNGGKSCVLLDPLPEPPLQTKSIKLQGEYNIVFICSYHDDEPYEEVIKAASLLPSNVCIYMTGNYKSKVDSSKLPSNLIPTGFLSIDDFWTYLYCSDFIMDLTTREGCLVCGAYESTSILKPMILSDTVIIRKTFCKGSVYTQPTATAIKESILAAINNKTKLQAEIVDLNRHLKQCWNEQFEHCKNQIYKI